MKHHFSQISKGIANILRVIRLLFFGGNIRFSLTQLRSILIQFFRISNQILLQVQRTQIPFYWIESDTTKKARKQMEGLHALLSKDGQFTYSILIALSKSNPIFLEQSIRSALNQTSPSFEILIGSMGEEDSQVQAVLSRLRGSHGRTSRIKIFAFQRVGKREEYSSIVNQLAAQAEGKYLLLLNQHDLIRPDLLYRYEQTLRLMRNPEEVVLYCNEFQIDTNGSSVPESCLSKPNSPVFPYVFVDSIQHSLLVSVRIWQKVEGFKEEGAGAEGLDLLLRLDLAGARFQNVPFLMYAARQTRQQVVLETRSKEHIVRSSVEVFDAYCQKKGLDWKIEEGYAPGQLRAIPPIKREKKIHVIIPFFNQKDLTLRAVDSIRNQKNVTPLITAIDNRSSDVTISLELQQRGVEVIKVDEPFNFSRICNIGARQSRYTSESDLLLFMNNDVEMNDQALEEMVRWIDQPKIGIVGARLHYPDQRVQHGGVQIASHTSTFDQLFWRHIGYRKDFAESGPAKVLTTCDAVTAACLLIRRETFENVQGFDEVWYPVGCSDTDLAAKVRKLGLLSFYTPYAYGIHYENATREMGGWDDFEASYWLFQNTKNRETLQTELQDPFWYDIDPTVQDKTH